MGKAGGKRAKRQEPAFKLGSKRVLLARPTQLTPRKSAEWEPVKAKYLNAGAFSQWQPSSSLDELAQGAFAAWCSA